MRALAVIVLSPLFDDDLGLLECVEDVSVEQLVTEVGTEAHAVAVLPRRTSLSRFEDKPLPGNGSDAGSLGPDGADPGPNLPGNELWPVVSPVMNEVIGLDMIGALQPETDARPIPPYCLRHR